jgi:hypothetical protein
MEGRRLTSLFFFKFSQMNGEKTLVLNHDIQHEKTLGNGDVSVIFLWMGCMFCHRCLVKGIARKITVHTLGDW